MKVLELAEQLKVTSEDILKTLKSLKLKAKDENQELSSVVVSVIKTELVKKTKAPAKKVSTAQKEKAPKKTKKATAEKTKKESTDKTKTKTKTKVKKEDKKEEKKQEKKDSKEPEKKSSKESKTKTASVDKKEEKKESKKKALVKESVKSRSKISKEPVITLKPLSRKKRRPQQADEKSKASEKTSLKQEVQKSEEGKALGQESRTGASMPSEKREGPLSDLEIKVPITVKELSVKIQQKPSVVLSRLMKMGVFCHINQSLEGEAVRKICEEFGFNFVDIKTQEEQLIDTHKQEDEDPKKLKPRAPVVTFMGHVDHGKTSLLDRIRKSKIADEEHGGITQHMGAYSVLTQKGRITFLDTPGHEAFTAMRSRGAHITDLVVLVIAADEGIMPQTEEAIDHARAAGVPIVVALNKIDRKNADPDRVKKQLSEKGLSPEDWGGDTIVVNVSAVTGEGIDDLLESMLLESEMLEMKANPDKRAIGIVVEAHLSQGKGAVTTLIVQGGTLKDGDYIVVGPLYGKVRAMFDDLDRNIHEAGPSMPVEVLGLSSVPEAGDKFYVVEDEKVARDITFKRQEYLKNKRLGASTRVTLEDLYSQMQEGKVKELNVIMKADVQGSLEALKDSLEKIPSDKVKLRFIHTGIGDVNASDVILAVASQAIIIAFHVAIGPRAKEELGKEPVDVRQYRIIYDAVNDVKNALEGLLEAKTKKEFQSRIEVKEVFKLSRQGIVFGCYVQKGKVIRKANADVIRDDEVIYSGKISSLKRFKDDVKEVKEGMECGIILDKFEKVEAGDIIQTYELIKIAQKL